MAENKGKEQGERVTIESKQSGKGEGDVGGELQLSEDVVAKIAGLAARQIEGISSLGRSRLVSFGDSPTRGIEAEVGKKQAALDIDIVIEYGVDIRSVAAQLRRRIAEEVNRMAGRDVVEVNINVIDIDFPGKEQPKEEEQPPAPPSKSRVE